MFSYRLSLTCEVCISFTCGFLHACSNRDAHSLVHLSTLLSRYWLAFCFTSSHLHPTGFRFLFSFSIRWWATVNRKLESFRVVFPVSHYYFFTNRYAYYLTWPFFVVPVSDALVSSCCVVVLWASSSFLSVTTRKRKRKQLRPPSVVSRKVRASGRAQDRCARVILTRVEIGVYE